MDISDPAITALIATLVSACIAGLAMLVGHLLSRKSSREAVRVSEGEAEVASFKVITDQLFAMNATLRADVSKLEAKVNAMMTAMDEKDTKIKWFTTVTSQMASYIERLIEEWPGTHAPPAPDPHVAWEDHL